MDDLCIHCGHPVIVVPLTGQLVHRETETVWCIGRDGGGRIACLPQAGVE